MNPNDPYQTQPLPPLTQALARPVSLPLAGLIALALAPSLLVAALLLWADPAPSAPPALGLLPSPTLGIARAAAPAHGLARATVAYDAPGGAPIGALEPGRAYRVIARAGLAWVQLDVAGPGEAPNLVWVAAGDIPEVAAVAGLADLATPAPTAAPEIVYVAAPAPARPAPAAPAAEAPAPTSGYLLPPATPAPQPMVVRAFPTAEPCTLREVGASLRVCNGIVP